VEDAFTDADEDVSLEDGLWADRRSRGRTCTRPQRGLPSGSSWTDADA
jgi:hypothetical protein